jgi:hypothetical protein
MRVFARRDLRWRDDGDGLALYHGKQIMAQIVPADRCPGLWRIRFDDGRLSDLANITRIKDAAVSSVLADLRMQETALAASPMRPRATPATHAQRKAAA